MAPKLPQVKTRLQKKNSIKARTNQTLDNPPRVRAYKTAASKSVHLSSTLDTSEQGGLPQPTLLSPVLNKKKKNTKSKASKNSVNNVANDVDSKLEALAMLLTQVHDNQARDQAIMMNRLTALEEHTCNSNHNKAESQVWEHVRNRTQPSPETSPQRTGYVREAIPTIQTMKDSEMVNRRVQERLDELENAADNLHQIPGSTVLSYNNHNKNQFNGYNNVVSPPASIE